MQTKEEKNMAFPNVSKATSSNASETKAETKAETKGKEGTATTAKINIPAVKPTESTPAPASTSGKSKTINLTEMYDRILFNLSESEITEPTDIALENLKGEYEELGDGIKTVATALGMEFNDQTAALRFMPARVGDDGKQLSPRLYLFSLTADEDHTTCILRWNDTQVTLDPDAMTHTVGIKILGDSSVIKLGGYVLPLAVIVKSGITDQERDGIKVADTFSELSPYLSVVKGSGILSDVPEDFRMLISTVTQEKAKSGNEYSLIHGVELDQESQVVGEVAIFNPTEISFWGSYLNETHVLVRRGNEYLIASAETGEQVDSCAIQSKTYKLKDFCKEGDVYEWVGVRLVELKDKSNSWVVDLRSKESGDVYSTWANTYLKNAIAHGAERILAACEQLPDDKSLDGITDLVCTEKPCAEITITGIEKVGTGVKVGMSATYRETEATKNAQKSRLASLGINL